MFADPRDPFFGKPRSLYSLVYIHVKEKTGIFSVEVKKLASV